MRHVNIPIFIPHLGCPNQCVFCNQRTISGVTEFDVSDCDRLINEALSTVSYDDEVEIAFFGGSFTGIDFDYMVSLLDIAYNYVKCGRVSSIRCSTRPDYIDVKILDTLKFRGVKTIELGLQSTDSEVLSLTKRGHSFNDEVNACKLIVDYGFDLVGQMMIGLPGSTVDKEKETADFIINSGAKGVRIYPTVVFRDTELCEMTRSGYYKPLTVEEAVDRSSAVLEKFIKAGIEVIRIGLCSSDNLISDETYYAGPNHPAIGELVLNELYFKKIVDQLRYIDFENKSTVNVYVSTGALSKAVGQSKRNKLRLLSMPFIKNVRFIESDDILPYEVMVRKENGDRKCI